jgi:hypothetical protein
MKAEVERVKALGDELKLRLANALDTGSFLVGLRRDLAISILALIRDEERRLREVLPDDDNVTPIKRG